MSGVLLIGGGPGLGRSIARRFARDGSAVTLVSRREETVQALAEEVAALGVRAHTARADAGDPDGLRAALAAVVDAHGLPDVVVYNAGLIQADRPGDLTADEHLHAWRINVLGAITTADVVLPGMATRGHGTMLVTGGMPVPVAEYLSLSLGKAGVRALVAMLAAHYGPAGVHVATVTVGGAIAPGTAFDPDDIAEHYHRLHREPPDNWTTELLLDGTGDRGAG